MPEWLMDLEEWLTADRMAGVARAAAILAGGLILAALLRRPGKARADRPRSPQTLMVRRGLSYVVVAVAIGWALHQLGLELGTLLGAAGILTVAVGFAAQTSMSNLISGLFLVWERPFVIGDIVTVEGVTGEVLAIDLLSLRLRTFDNLQIRIPNETLIKSHVTTLTSFPIRRYDAHLSVAYKEDLDRVRAVLFEVADRNPICLEEPQPMFLLLGFGESGVQIQFSVWTRQENWIDLRNALLLQIKQAFDAAGIEIPVPHRSLYAGAATEPLPIRLVGADPVRPGPGPGGD